MTTPAQQPVIDIEAAAERAQALAVRQGFNVVAPVAPQQESFESLMKLAESLVATGFLPVAVKTPAQAVAIILTGRELGLPPMQALRSICIIQGKPELAADLQLSIFHRDGGKSKWVALTNAEAVLWLRHPNGDEHTETFAMVDAQRAGLTGANWQKYPKAMLRSRAITAGLKSIGFEPLTGAYAPGEIGGPESKTMEEPAAIAPEIPSTPQKTSQNALGTAAPVSRPPTAAQGTNASAAPSAASAQPQFATDATRKWMLEQLKAVEGGSNRETVRTFLEQIAWLAPFEALEELELRFVPVSKPQLQALGEAIARFATGEPVKEPYPPNGEPKAGRAAKAPAPAAQAPANLPASDPNSPDAPWRSFPMPFGKDAGTTLAALSKNKLFGWWANHVVETEYNGKPKKPETIAKDTLFREMLDAAGTHYGFEKKD